MQSRVAGAAAPAGSSTLQTLSRDISNFLLGDPEAFPGQLGDLVPLSGPRSAPGSLPSGTCTEDLHRETLGWNLY